MGTSLTGLTPATTYDALIKVGDNGPLSATAKVLSDGLGNDSPLAMSTTLVGIGTATPDARLSVKSIETNAKGITILGRSDDIGTIRFFNSAGTSEQGGMISTATSFGLMYNDVTRLHITAATGNVGISTTSPFGKLSVSVDASAPTPSGSMTSNLVVHNTGVGRAIQLGINESSAYNYIQSAYVNNADTGTPLAVFIGNAERARFTTNGLTFNGDTSASNALDDYEEGDWTVTITPGTSGTISIGTNSCRYTKIGRQVYIQGLIVVSSVSSPIGTKVVLGGLPFTIGGATTADGRFSPTAIFSQALLSYAQTSLPCLGVGTRTTFDAQMTASTIVVNDEFTFSATYTV